MKPGDTFKYKDRVFRIRLPEEDIQPTDYHMKKGTASETNFAPLFTVSDAGAVPNARSKERYWHVHDVTEPLIEEMKKVLKQQQANQQKSEGDG